MSTALVVTSINPPNAALLELASGCIEHGWDFVIAGDSKSPPDFHLEGCRFLSLRDQRDSGFSLAAACPERSYTRKNIGYLDAIRSGADVVVETDDDNHPRAGFWLPRRAEAECEAVQKDGWVNAYRYFSSKFIYPRGLPLNHARDETPSPGQAEIRQCPIQQGLADADPDVDAVYRMLYPLPFHFELERGPLLLSGGAWCPFNSQNTTFFAEAFPLLYLPAHCSFRMTDIWRSFVAQRVMHSLGHGILFHGATVWQERNDHDLQKDYMDERPGYEHNAGIREALKARDFPAGASMREMVERCYQTLIRNGWVGAAEEDLLASWFHDLESLSGSLNKISR